MEAGLAGSRPDRDGRFSLSRGSERGRRLRESSMDQRFITKDGLSRRMEGLQPSVCRHGRHSVACVPRWRVFIEWKGN